MGDMFPCIPCSDIRDGAAVPSCSHCRRKTRGLLCRYCDAVIAQINSSSQQSISSSKNLDTQTEWKPYDSKSSRRSANAQIIGSIGGLIRDVALAGAAVSQSIPKGTSGVSTQNFIGSGLEPLGW